MTSTIILNWVLWGAQGIVALFFFAAGCIKLSGRGMERWAGFTDLPRGQIVYIGLAEVLGATAVVLPMSIGVLPWLTPIAAVAICVLVLMATGFHLRARERAEAADTLLWATVAAAVAIGRWTLIPEGSAATPWIVTAVVIVLVPATIATAIIVRRSEA